MWRLLDSSGIVLETHAAIEACTLRHGDSLVMHVNAVHACGSEHGFAQFLEMDPS